MFDITCIKLNGKKKNQDVEYKHEFSEIEMVIARAAAQPFALWALSRTPCQDPIQP